jgi:hypothetical protein
MKGASRTAVAAAVFLSLLCALGLAVTRSTWRSDAALKSHFLKHRADFERLVAMANEDVHLTRIAPDFTWLDDSAAWPRENVGISAERWNEYRKLFRQVGVGDGLGKNIDPPRIFFPIVSGGLVPTSWTKGLVYSPVRLSPVVKSLDHRVPDRFWHGSQVLVYKPIEDHWYIYYQE